MRISLFLISFLLIFTTFTSCKTQKKQIKETQPTTLSDNLFLKMQRTPCYGKCPNYTLEIFESGKVKYNGKMFVENIGEFESVLSTTSIQTIKNKIKEINFFELNDKYDSPATDIPATIFEVFENNQQKKITNRHKSPESLKELEKLIEDIVYQSNLKPINK